MLLHLCNVSIAFSHLSVGQQLVVLVVDLLLLGLFLLLRLLLFLFFF